ECRRAGRDHRRVVLGRVRGIRPRGVPARGGGRGDHRSREPDRGDPVHPLGDGRHGGFGDCGGGARGPAPPRAARTRAAAAGGGGEEVLGAVRGWAVVVSSGLRVLLLAALDRFLALFTRDGSLLAIGVPYLRILALTVIATGIEIATAESVMGSGHTREISTIYTAFSIIRIPLAFIVPRWGHAGVFGIAWLITITCTLRAILLVGWAARGTWRRGLTRELHGGAAESSTIPSGAGAKMD